MIKTIPTSDISIRPFKVYKEWSLDSTDIPPKFGNENTSSMLDSAGDILYDVIKSQYYRGQATASILYEYGKRKSYASTDERLIESSIAVLVVPQIMFGEGIKEGSVSLLDAGIRLVDDGYSNLVDTGSVIKGNVFYDRGMVVLTKDVVSGSTLLDFSLSFKSTKTIYENEIFISVLENEFNVSQNPTAIEYISGSSCVKSNTIQSAYNPLVYGGFADYIVSSSVDPTGSFLAPYITTIGLYDDALNMVAVAKLPQAIKSMPDYPINFIVRFDS